ncbi:MAG TPA: hypothetical protein VEG68_05440 [Terriglobales bacterium]|nr:hypothetical protein [Terriglobales bacterium]
MMLRRLGYELALVAIVCTLAIFLFPAVSGPYPIVHGPVTALRAMRAWLLLLIALTLPLFGLARLSTIQLGVAALCIPIFNRIDPLQQSSVLRC